MSDVIESTPVIRFYTEEQLSPNQEETPEGFLLLKNVPVARTGGLVYLDKEMPWIDPGPDNLVHIERLADDVFAPNAIASFNGKPVTNDHPPEKVTPANYKKYSVGTVLFPRRGDGQDFADDILYADLLIKDADAIRAVRSGKIQVSAGYDARYTRLAPGLGQQKDIIGNHVALVDKGRCGARCSIMDQDKDNKIMTKKVSFKDRLLSAFYARDEEGMKELVKDPDLLGEVFDEPGSKSAPAKEEPTTKDATTNDVADKLVELFDRVGYLEEAVVALGSEGGSSDAKTVDAKDEDEDETEEEKEARLKKERAEKKSDDAKSVATKPAKDEKEDETEEEKEARLKKEEEEKKKSDDAKAVEAKTNDKKSTTDSAALSGVFQDVLSKAELLAPGIRHPVFDAATPFQSTMETICDFRRRALIEGYKGESADAIKEVLDGRDPVFTADKLTCDSVATVFNGASILKRALNNTGKMVTHLVNRNAVIQTGPADIKALNEKYQAYYKNQGQL